MQWKRYNKTTTISYDDKEYTTEQVVWEWDEKIKTFNGGLKDYNDNFNNYHYIQPNFEIHLIPKDSLYLHNIWSVASFSKDLFESTIKEIEEKKANGYIEVSNDMKIIITYDEMPVKEEDFESLCHEISDKLLLEYFPNTHCIVVRSYEPKGQWSDNGKFKYDYPWKRTGRRSYLWVVPLKDKDVDPGRRIQWGEIPYYKTRKDALDALYNNNNNKQ